MKKITALILSLIMLVSFAYCTKAPPDNDTTTVTSGKDSSPVTQKPAETTSSFEGPGGETDFHGHIFTFAMSLNTSSGYEVDGDGQSAEIISTAIEKRNSDMEKLYNCKIQKEDILLGNLEADFWSNTNKIDLVCSVGIEKSPEKYINLNSLGIDFSKDIWFSSFMNSNSMDGKNYSAICYGSLSVFDYTPVIIFNKSLKNASNSLKDTDLYELVKSNKWTLDKLHEVIKLAANDTGKQGLACDNEFSAVSLYFSAGGRYSKFAVSADGDITVNSAINNTSVYLTDKIIEIFSDSATGIYSSYMLHSNMLGSASTFAIEEIHMLREYAKSPNNVELGILPLPVGVADNMGYRSYPENNLLSLGVPKTCTDIDRISRFLELYARHSKETVYPEYIKWVASHADGENTAEMLDYILKNPISDIAQRHAWAKLDVNFSKDILNGKNTFKDKISEFETIIVESANSYRETLKKAG